MKKNLLILFLLGFVHFAIGQVRNVTYSLEYNGETCLFDCYLNVVEGNTNSVRDRVQLGAQITVIAPLGSLLKIEKSYMPLIENIDFRGVNPIEWNVNSLIDNSIYDKSYFSISPGATPTSFYNDMSEGDKIKLFSLDISPKPDCASGVRLYKNGKDASSSDEGMLGSDFRNGFSIGGVGEKYTGNELVVYPSAPKIEALNIVRGNTVQINADIKQLKTSCQQELSYQWYSPKGLISTSKDFPTMNQKEVLKGDYKLVVIDELGCKDEKVFNLLNADSNGEEVLSAIDDEEGNIYSSSIYPNPSTNVINLLIEGKVGTRVQASVYDMSGSVLKANILDEKLSSESQEFKVATGLSTGLYSVGIFTNDNQKKYHKLIIVE